MHDTLDRFRNAQAPIIQDVICEILSGQKKGHWMWYIFPQLGGLIENESDTTKFYALVSKEETLAYHNNSVLGVRLKICIEYLLSHKDKSIEDIMAYPDNLKLQSSMTLFAECTNDPIYIDVLDTFFNGEKDLTTVELLHNK